MNFRSKYAFGFEVRPVLRLVEIELILKHTRVISPVPSRHTLIAMIEDGSFEGKKLSCGWVVYEDTFKSWVRSLQPAAYAPFPPQSVQQKIAA